MSDAPKETPPQTKTPVDTRLIEFSYASDCDINAMKAAVELLQQENRTPPANGKGVANYLSNVRSPGDLKMDFNKDGNVTASGVTAASNREWAAALIAVAQLWREKGVPPEKLEVQDIIDRGQCIYDQFKDKELNKTTAVCKTSPSR